MKTLATSWMILSDVGAPPESGERIRRYAWEPRRGVEMENFVGRASSKSIVSVLWKSTQLWESMLSEQSQGMKYGESPCGRLQYTSNEELPEGTPRW
jgi:hypothetical protein